MVIWYQEYSPGADYDIWGRYIAGDGSMASQQLVYETTTEQSFQLWRATLLGEHTWQLLKMSMPVPMNTFGISARSLFPNQTMNNAFGIIVPGATGGRLQPAAACGRFSCLVVWQHQRDGNGLYDIHGRFVELSISCTSVTEIPQSECEALAALYTSANGSAWKEERRLDDRQYTQ